MNTLQQLQARWDEEGRTIRDGSRAFIQRHHLNDADFLIMCVGIAFGVAGVIVGAFPELVA